MIWEWLYGQFVAVLEGIGQTVASLVPPVPSWIADAIAGVSTVVGKAGTIGTWVPWGIVVASVGLVVLVMIAGLGIQLARIVASFLTLGGGGT